jgi:hypothetical protein
MSPMISTARGLWACGKTLVTELSSERASGFQAWERSNVTRAELRMGLESGIVAGRRIR